MPSVFGQSLYACGGTVAGKRLQPFSAHHAMMLIEIESPYIEGGSVSLWDTTAAMIVCCSNRADGASVLARFCDSFWARLGWRLWWLVHSHTIISEEMQDYISTSVKAPEVWIEKDFNGSSTGAPWPYYIVSVIGQEMPSIEYDRLWDMPLAEMACHKAIIDERSGGAQIAENELKIIEKRRGTHDA